MNFSNKTIPNKAEIVDWGPFGDQLVLYNAMSKQYFVLTSIAARAWELLDGKRTLNDITTLLVKQYDASKEEILRDVKGLFDGLSDFGLIEIKK